MKSNSVLISVAAAFLAAVTIDAQALSPRQHQVSGVVESFDLATHVLTLRSKPGAAPQIFVWNDGTRFSSRGGCVKCGLDSGQTIRVWYRREAGRNTLREVSTKGAVAGCHAVPE
jgi:hypothetical protein